MLASTSPRVEVSSQQILLDGVTPIAAYAALHGSMTGPAFLLESSPGAGELARHSIIALGTLGELIAARGEVFVSTPLRRQALSGRHIHEAARRLLRECRPAHENGGQTSFLGAYGIAAFEFASYLEDIHLKPAALDDAPDMHLVVPKVVVAFDHYTHIVTISSLSASGDAAAEDPGRILERLRTARVAPPMPPRESAQLCPCPAAAEFSAMVDRAKAAIREGEIFQVVLSQRWEATLDDPFSVYRRLRSINPSPYMFYVELAGRVLLGSSPEMLCKLDGRQARLRPLAGTRPRPASAELERSVARKLQRDPKERAEHIMLVDLGRNDLGRVCDYGSVRVSELLAVERYSHVMHLVSEVRGTLRCDLDAFDLFAATFPAGTVSGAPKIRAMQLIAHIEQRRRGAYGGSVVRFGFDGSLDACIVLRSAEVRDGIASVTAGAGIVADSVARLEDAECRAKASAVRQALESVEVGP